MELYVFNKNIELIGVIDVYNTFSRLRRYTKHDTFKLTCPSTDENARLLKEDNILVSSNRQNEGLVIVNIDGKTNDKGLSEIVVDGVCLSSYLSRRIVWGQVVHKGTTEKLMRTLVDKQCITTSPERVINGLTLGNENGIGKVIDYQISYTNLLESLETISEANGISFVTNVDIKTKKLIFNVFEGRNLTTNQNVLPPCIFSNEFENIIEENFATGFANYRNVCLVAGAGEGIARKRVTVGNTTGLNRFEIFVDARDLSDKETTTNAQGEQVEVPINANVYNNMLTERGNAKLAECTKVLVFDGKVNPNGSMIYKKDFDLGDLITVISKKWGLVVHTRIAEIEELYNKDGFNVFVTLGDSMPTLIDMIKQKMG